MNRVNARIREHRALGPNYVLGHSFFCSYSPQHDGGPAKWADRVFKSEIRPMLEEYTLEHPKLRQELLDAINDMSAPEPRSADGILSANLLEARVRRRRSARRDRRRRGRFRWPEPTFATILTAMLLRVPPRDFGEEVGIGVFRR
jgi:hypothetical protein